MGKTKDLFDMHESEDSESDEDVLFVVNQSDVERMMDVDECYGTFDLDDALMAGRGRFGRHRKDSDRNSRMPKGDKDGSGHITRNNKDPPPYDGEGPFDLWVEKVRDWQCYTELAKHRHGYAVFAALRDRARTLCIDLEHKQFGNSGGVDYIIDHLRPLCVRDGWHAFLQQLASLMALRRGNIDFLLYFKLLNRKLD